MSDDMLTVPLRLPCDRCLDHPATENWPPDVHAGAALQRLCRCCFVEAKLEQAHRAADSIPALEAELTGCCASLPRRPENT